MPITLLFLAANPTDTARIRVDQECRAIDKALRGAEFRDHFTLENHGAVRVEDFPELLLRYRPHILHFSGHGITANKIALEDNAGNIRPVPLDVLTGWFAVLPDNLRCVVLNACDTADQALAIAEHIDCVIGMSQAISDSGALAFSTAFYQALAYGRNLKTAFELARIAIQSQRLEEQDMPRLIALHVDPAQIVLAVNTATPQPKPSPDPTSPVDLTDLPFRNEPFLGRIAELEILERHLTGDTHPRLLTLYAAGGQGKTTLARQAVERFASTWPGGVLAISFENLPTCPDLVVRLAEFLHIDSNQRPDQIQRQVTRALERRRTLLVLDNAETLVDELDRSAPNAADLADFLQNQLPPSVTLFITSRRRLGLPGEVSIELAGLTPAEGARLFQQHAPDCQSGIDLKRAEALSLQLEGHPLSLRLLGIAFNNFGPDLEAFIQQFETQLTHATDKYKRLDHRQRSLFASIETSIHPLPPELKTLFGNLALFHSPFRPRDAAAIFDPDTKESSIPTQLWQLWQRGILERQTYLHLELYHLAPPIRLYAEQNTTLPPQALKRFAQVYGDLISWIYDEINKDPSASMLAHLSTADLERALEHSEDILRGWYNLWLGGVERRQGNTWKSKPHIEQALEYGRDHDRKLMLEALNELGFLYGSLGQPQEALKYYQEALPIWKEVGEPSGEAATLNNIGVIYQGIGQPQEALKYYHEALPMIKECGKPAGEATTLTNIGVVYNGIGQSQEALKYLQQALPICKQVGDRVREATTLNSIGVVYQSIGQPQEALKYFREALPISNEMGDRVGKAAAFTNIGMAYNSIGQPQEALKYCQEALPIMKEVGNRSAEATTLNNIGMIYNSINQPHEALEYYLEALPIIREVVDRSGEATTLNNIGMVYHSIGQPQQALKYCQEALLIMKEVGNRVGEAATLTNIGTVYNSISQPREALKYYQEALPITREVGNRSEEATKLHNIGSLYNIIGQPQEALKYSQEALSIMKEVGNRDGEATALHNMGGIFNSIGQPQKALKYYSEALLIMKEVGNRDGEARTLNNIGGIYDSMSQPQKALKYYSEALLIMKEAGNRDGEATALHNMGGVYRSIGQPREALKYYQEVLPIVKELGNRDREATTLTDIGSIYNSIGQRQEALTYFKEALPIMKETGAVAGEAAILYVLALIIGLLGETGEALSLLQRSISLFRSNHLSHDDAGQTLTDHKALLSELKRQTQQRKISHRNKH